MRLRLLIAALLGLAAALAPTPAAALVNGNTIDPRTQITISSLTARGSIKAIGGISAATATITGQVVEGGFVSTASGTINANLLIGPLDTTQNVGIGQSPIANHRLTLMGGGSKGIWFSTSTDTTFAGGGNQSDIAHAGGFSSFNGHTDRFQIRADLSGNMANRPPAYFSANGMQWNARGDQGSGNYDLQLLAGNLSLFSGGVTASTGTFTAGVNVASATINSGSTQLFYCNGGTFTGNICRGAACICTGGSAAPLGIFVP